MKNFKIVYAVGVIILTGLIIAVIFNYQQQGTKITKINLIERPVVTNEEKATTEKMINDNITAENFYRVQLQLNSGVSEPKPDDFNGDYSTSNLGDYLVNILQLGKPTANISYDNFFYLIAYDSTQGEPYGNASKFNSDYYIFLKSGVGVIDLQKTYKNAEFSAVVSKASPKLLPFIKNPNYCELNTDCLVRNNWCDYASFNKFKTFRLGGCEYGNYPQENEKELSATCPPAIDPMVSPYEVKYTGSKCISNKCVAQNREVKCVNQVLP